MLTGLIGEARGRVKGGVNLADWPRLRARYDKQSRNHISSQPTSILMGPEPKAGGGKKSEVSRAVRRRF